MASSYIIDPDTPIQLEDDKPTLLPLSATMEQHPSRRQRVWQRILRVARWRPYSRLHRVLIFIFAALCIFGIVIGTTLAYRTEPIRAPAGRQSCGGIVLPDNLTRSGLAFTVRPINVFLNNGSVALAWTPYFYDIEDGGCSDGVPEWEDIPGALVQLYTDFDLTYGQPTTTLFPNRTRIYMESGIVTVTAGLQLPSTMRARGQANYPAETFDITTAVGAFIKLPNGTTIELSVHAIDFVGEVYGFEVHLENSPTPLNGTDWSTFAANGLQMNIFLGRSAVVIAVVIALCILIWLLALTFLWFAVNLMLFRQQLPPNLIALGPTVIFAIPQIRNTMPMVPTFGTYVDVAVIFPALLVVGMTTVIMLWEHTWRTQDERYKPKPAKAVRRQPLA